MQGLAVLLGDEFFLELGEGMIRQLLLGVLDGPQQTGLGDEAGGEIDAMLGLEA